MIFEHRFFPPDDPNNNHLNFRLHEVDAKMEDNYMTMIIGDLVNAIRVEDEENKEVAQKQEGSKSNVHDAEGDKNYADVSQANNKG